MGPGAYSMYIPVRGQIKMYRYMYSARVNGGSGTVLLKGLSYDMIAKVSCEWRGWHSHLLSSADTSSCLVSCSSSCRFSSSSSCLLAFCSGMIFNCIQCACSSQSFPFLFLLSHSLSCWSSTFSLLRFARLPLRNGKKSLRIDSDDRQG